MISRVVPLRSAATRATVMLGDAAGVWNVHVFVSTVSAPDAGVSCAERVVHSDRRGASESGRPRFTSDAPEGVVITSRSMSSSG